MRLTHSTLPRLLATVALQSFPLQSSRLLQHLNMATHGTGTSPQIRSVYHLILRAKANEEAETIRSNLALVLARIGEIRKLHNIQYPVRLVAVSKTKPPSAIRAAYDAGHRDFGENYLQEL